MMAFLATQRRRLVVERLPGYAHDLNPTEKVWGKLKSSELANLCPDTIADDRPTQHAEAGLDRIGTDHPLCMAVLKHTGLSL
jgi:transposase